MKKDWNPRVGFMILLEHGQALLDVCHGCIRGLMYLFKHIALVFVKFLVGHLCALVSIVVQVIFGSVGAVLRRSLVFVRLRFRPWFFRLWSGLSSCRG